MWKKEKIIFEICAEGNTVQVIDKTGRRELRFGNTVVQSAVSLVNPDHLLLKYTQYMMLGFVLKPETKSVLHIGLGAGNILRFIHTHFPAITHDVIENNPDIPLVASQYFDMPQTQKIQIHIADAGKWVPQCNKQYDLIMLDAFGPHGTPTYLMTPLFLSQLKNCLKPQSWVVGNVWTLRMPLNLQLPFWQEVFPQVIYAPTQPIGNVVLFGGNQEQKTDMKTIHYNAKALQARIPLEFYDLCKSMHLDATPVFVDPLN
ncbi:MnmC family methyltransferase [Deltaproteobacteria bacterium TL4]